VRIDSGQPGALEVDWQVINVSPAKHHGYAVQWFAMALALAVIFGFRSSNLWEFLTWRKRTQD
jgi:cytochrome oxidase assembly protein ShyY1